VKPAGCSSPRASASRAADVTAETSVYVVALEASGAWNVTVVVELE
jgi:hypothetical protein